MQQEVDPQYFSGPYRPREANLYLAKIIQHYTDAARKQFSIGQNARIEQEHNKRYALHWFFSRDGVVSADFECFCEEANLEPVWVREIIRTALKHNLSPFQVRLILRRQS